MGKCCAVEKVSVTHTTFWKEVFFWMSVEEGKRGIPIIGKKVCYQAFLNEFLRPLKPCIVSGLTEEWPATNRWTTIDPSTGTLIPNFSHLNDIFGKYECCITFCNEKDSNGNPIQKEMSVSEFINSILAHETSDKQYLKDFHFMRINPSLPTPYSVPEFFQGMFPSYIQVNRCR